MENSMNLIMMNMKSLLRTIVTAGMFLPVALLAENDSDPVGGVVYSLPSTVVNIEVDAVLEKFYAGPYAKYAEKYLGLDVRQADESACHVTDVRMSTSVEADMNRRYVISAPGGKLDAAFLKMSSSGLVAFGNAGSEDVVWRFPVSKEADFSAKGISSNLTSEAAVLYKNGKKSKVGVQQNMLVAKTLEQKAEEAAEMILDIRAKRFQIVVGDTDATYSGEALGAAVAELTRLEEEYLVLFTGYSEFQQQKLTYDVVPDASLESQRYIAFRISDTEGLVAADNLSGKPVVLELVPQNIADLEPVSEKESKKIKAPLFYYSIPAVCNVRLTDGMKVLYQGRFPVYQLGKVSSMPANVILK